MENVNAVVDTLGEGEYSVRLPVYTGPMDLLLRLIEREELDITKVALADVTEQYIQYIRELQDENVEGLAEFLVMAARLVLIKSQALLPRTEKTLVVEADPGEELAKQLIMYRMYKGVSEDLGERQGGGYRTFVRLVTPARVNTGIDLGDFSIDDMVPLFNAAMQRPPPGRSRVSEVVGRPRFSVRGRIRAIGGLLRRSISTSFFGLLRRSESRGEIVATFLAILELSRRNMVSAEQEEAFGDIKIVRLGTWRDVDVRALDTELDKHDE